MIATAIRTFLTVGFFFPGFAPFFPEPLNFFPHEGQKAACASTDAPQLGHVVGPENGVPHIMQTFEPSGDSAPHLLQIILFISFLMPKMAELF